MTLLESVIAFVLLAVVGVACLDLTRGALRLETSSMEWTRAVAIGESALQSAAAGDAPEGPAFRGVEIVRRPWAAGEGRIDLIEVRVPLPGGAEFRAARLVQSSRALAGTGAAR